MWKKNTKKVKVLMLMIALMISEATFLCEEIAVNADDTTINVSGKQYEMEEDSEYIYSVESKGSNILASGSQFGKFTIKGNVENMSSVNGFTAFKVKDGVIQFSYVPDGKVINAINTDPHLYEDTTKEVNGISLGGKVGKGALILQTSNDATHWITDIIERDIAGDDTDYLSDFFKSQEIQQINGCYYRVIIAYKTEEKVGETSAFLEFGTKDVNEYKEFAEVYEFYLRDTSEEIFKNGTHSNNRKIIGDMSNVVNTGRDNGFSGKDDILADDPHYGWKLGEFSLTGFTDDVDRDGKKYFLKTVGDEISLSFSLFQDIHCLNGNPELSISSDKNGYDQYFQIKKTDFKRGTLIIQYKDYNNKIHDPIIYTDYLEAFARTGADTRIMFFEEGDYEVALDYEILDSDGFDSYTNYRMSFEFGIRNGSNMVYAFDNKTKSQLADGAITAKGFTIDTANSHYLNIFVKKHNLSDKASGGKKTDIAWSKKAADGSSYNEPGIYEITVSNEFLETDDITKTYYVGTDPFLKAMSKTGKSVEELNDKLEEGYTISANGTLNPPPTSTPTPTSAAEASSTPEPEPTDTDAKDEPSVAPTATPIPTPTDIPLPTTAMIEKDAMGADNVVNEDSNKEDGKILDLVPIVVVLAVIVTAGGLLYIKKRKNPEEKSKTGGEDQ